MLSSVSLMLEWVVLYSLCVHCQLNTDNFFGNEISMKILTVIFIWHSPVYDDDEGRRWSCWNEKMTNENKTLFNCSILWVEVFDRFWCWTVISRLWLGVLDGWSSMRRLCLTWLFDTENSYRTFHVVFPVNWIELVTVWFKFQTENCKLRGWNPAKIDINHL